MRNDQIFVLMLVILLPMSGCFDDAVGDAEGTEDSNGTTIINNYYNNTTNVIQDSPVVMSINGPSVHPANSNEPGVSISISPNQVLEVMQIWHNRSSADYHHATDYIDVKVSCDSFETTLSSLSSYYLGHYLSLPTDGGNCSYWFYHTGSSSNPEIYVNVIYMIHN